MPKVQYVYRIEGEEEVFREEDVLPRGVNIELRGKQQVMLWNERAEERGEPQRELVRVNILDAFLHEHEWTVQFSHKVVGKYDYVICNCCNVEGTRAPDSHTVTRKIKWESNHYEHCHEEKPKPSKPRFK
jgi:hypothetical protein